MGVRHITSCISRSTVRSHGAPPVTNLTRSVFGFGPPQVRVSWQAHVQPQQPKCHRRRKREPGTGWREDHVPDAARARRGVTARARPCSRRRTLRACTSRQSRALLRSSCHRFVTSPKYICNVSGRLHGIGRMTDVGDRMATRGESASIRVNPRLVSRPRKSC
jgi:hypothetical protein